MKKNLAKAFELHNSNFALLVFLADHCHLVPDNLLKTLLAVVRFMPNAYPRIETIAQMTGHSTRTVIRKIQRLEELGFVRVTREHRKSNKYELILGDTYLSLKEESRVTNCEVRVTNSALLGDTYLSPQHINKHINIKHIKDSVINDCVKNADEGDVDPDMVSPETRERWMMKAINKTD